MSVASVTRYVAAASAIACAGFSVLGAVQVLRYTPHLYQVGVPLWLSMPVARASHALGEPMRQWAVGAHVDVLKALPAPVRYAAIELYNPQLLVPKSQSPVPEGAKGRSAPSVLRQAAPVAPVAPARVARPTPFASSPNSPAVAQQAQPTEVPSSIPPAGRFSVYQGDQQ